jgi:TPP-dependent pyruvate/acetoin dehydrogenase alpha subunit
MAAAEKAKASNAVVALFLGDGALGEGVVYESINIAALWKLPILFVVENNRYAQTTPVRLGLSGTIAARFAAFGVETLELATTDVREIYDAALHAVSEVRRRMQPYAIVLETYRLAPHSKGDDTRDPEEVEYFRQFDPIPLHSKRVDEPERQRIQAECAEEVESAFQYAEAAPFPDNAQVGEMGTP